MSSRRQKAAQRSYSLGVNCLLSYETKKENKPGESNTGQRKNRTLPPAWMLKSWSSKSGKSERSMEEVGSYVVLDETLDSLVVRAMAESSARVLSAVYRGPKKTRRGKKKRTAVQSREVSPRRGSSSTYDWQAGLRDFGSRREREEWEGVRRYAGKRFRGSDVVIPRSTVSDSDARVKNGLCTCGAYVGDVRGIPCPVCNSPLI